MASLSTIPPRVSIGLPVYNGADYLDVALDSLLAQTFTDFEIIISDNASTDGTEAICRRYAAQDSRIRYHRNPANLGAARNYNQTLSLARGEYFKWAAHDDTCAPQFLERCVWVLDRSPSVSLAYARVTNIDQNARVIERYETGFNLTSPDPVERFAFFFSAPAQCSPVFGVMRTDTLRKTLMHGDFIAADRILLGELALIGKIYEVPENLFFRRIHPKMSTEAHRGKRDRMAWFDPAKRNQVQLVKWRWLREYLKAIQRVPLRPLQRLQCKWIVIRHLLPLRKWPAMAKELVFGLVEMLRLPIPLPDDF